MRYSKEELIGRSFTVYGDTYYIREIIDDNNFILVKNGQDFPKLPRIDGQRRRWEASMRINSIMSIINNIDEEKYILLELTEPAIKDNYEII